uniref:G_PROTEIN_RECEP_F1_2 domain-containing protein n=1 Tax=Macrostomum lignano TaxID=282301 RepID=A0A1I8GTK1_9PLAT
MHCARRDGFELAASTLDCVITALVPGFAICALNCCIGCRVRGAYRRLLAKSTEARRSCSAPQLLAGADVCNCNEAAVDRMRRSRQVTRMLLCVCLAYLLLNLPNSAAMLFSALLPADASQGWVLRALLARRYAQAVYLLHFSANSAVCACATRRYRTALICAAERIRDSLVILRCCDRPSSQDGDVPSSNRGNCLEHYGGPF